MHYSYIYRNYSQLYTIRFEKLLTFSAMHESLRKVESKELRHSKTHYVESIIIMLKAFRHINLISLVSQKTYKRLLYIDNEYF